MYNIDLPNGTDEFIKVIKTYASNNVKTDDNSEYETKLSVIEQKLEELRVNYKRVTYDLEKETVQKDGQNQEDANVVLPEDSDEWKEIKAPEGTTEWIKSFYDVFKSRNDKGEHIFAIDGLFRPIIDKCPNLRNWNDIEVELDTIRGSLKRNIKLGCYNDSEKERALTQIEKIEELVNKLNELIREKKAPQGFDGNPDPSIWENLSEDKTIEKTNIDWDNAFRDVFNKTNDGGKRIFNLLVDTVLINECPSVKNTDELYNNILTIMDIAGSDDNISADLNENKKSALRDLITQLSELQNAGKAPIDFDGHISLKEFENYYNNIPDNGQIEDNLENLEENRAVMNEINSEFKRLDNEANNNQDQPRSTESLAINEQLYNEEAVHNENDPNNEQIPGIQGDYISDHYFNLYFYE